MLIGADKQYELFIPISFENISYFYIILANF